jgi:hypothetical protein
MNSAWVFVFALIALSAAGVDETAAQPTLTWASGLAGGGWETIANGMATLVHEYAGLDVRVVSGGGTQNAVLVQRGDAAIGLGMPPLLGAAARGEDPYAGRQMADLRALAGNMSPSALHFYVAADSPFARMTIEEIVSGRKPIRLSLAKPGTADVWVMEKVMAYYGLCAPDRPANCYKSWEAEGAAFLLRSYAEQTVAFRDRHVDGGFALLGVPATSIVEASVGRPLVLLPLSTPLIEHLARFGFTAGAIPPGSYPKAVNGSDTVLSAMVGTTIAVSAKMPDDIAYRIARSINDHPEGVRQIHPSLAGYDPSKAWLNLGVALHPGAERYYRERGWLK